jgi:L-lysine epsilon oxidase C-terminal domain
MLDRASLEFCLADAFHPGCEMTWPMRTAGLYMAPFRIAHAAPGWIGAHAREGAAAIPMISLAFLTTWGQSGASGCRNN